ncbi:MAG: PIN domain-containing protein [Gemmatimonadota bacterium]
MSAGLVVDTSVWIDFFAGRSVPVLEEALALGSVVLSPIVLAELVSGARREVDLEALLELLDDMPLHEAGRDHWIRVGQLRAGLAAAGIAVSTPDAHVAQCALDRGALLLSRDAVFARIADHSELRLAG